jgi:undecaprenyl diphosphate synthase
MTKIKHVAIIMDGNGRWAQQRTHSRFWGHIRGAGVISNIVEEAKSLGIKSLTLFAFSTENWSRPKEEIHILFNLLKKYLIKEKSKIIKNQIRFRVLGNIQSLPVKTQELIKELEFETKHFESMELNFAFDYGGRNEILNSVNNYILKNPGQTISEKDFLENLDPDSPKEIDLLIRTGGDLRISNFLLWQIAYAELYFTNISWPDFTKGHFREIILDVSSRERRFGSVGPKMNIGEVYTIANHHKENFVH